MSYTRIISIWAGVVSNHRRPEPMDLQSIPFNHSGTYPNLIISTAGRGTQTPDPPITSRKLYQLSYTGGDDQNHRFTADYGKTYQR